MTPMPAPATCRTGTFPWLPWPLRAMSSWTTPVRAERLAALRVALAAILLCDVLTSYWPDRGQLFGPDSIGTLDLYSYYARGDRFHWSILRGPANDLNFTLALAAAVGLLVWLVVEVRTRHFGNDPAPPRSSAWAVVAWCFFSGVCVAGFWVRLFQSDEIDADAPVRIWTWLAPLMLAIVSGCLWAVEAWGDRRVRRDAGLRAWWIAAWVWFPLLTAGGFLLRREHWAAGDAPTWIRTLLEPWLLSREMITGSMFVWISALGLLLIGWNTRVAAVVCWVMSLSFANVQSTIDNAGDTLRDIMLFYLMFCPSGAAWSIDRWIARPRSTAAAVVSPWPIRLLFTQMVIMYFMNGMGKIPSSDWREGRTLYLVLHDLTLTRFSFSQLPLTYEMTRWLTWTTLVWELTFPILVLWRPSRIVALLMGVGFHVGIGLTMDLGWFPAYALCMYVPLLPWGRAVHASK